MHDYVRCMPLMSRVSRWHSDCFVCFCVLWNIWFYYLEELMRPAAEHFLRRQYNMNYSLASGTCILTTFFFSSIINNETQNMYAHMGWHGWANGASIQMKNVLLHMHIRFTQSPEICILFSLELLRICVVHLVSIKMVKRRCNIVSCAVCTSEQPVYLSHPSVSRSRASFQFSEIVSPTSQAHPN